MPIKFGQYNTSSSQEHPLIKPNPNPAIITDWSGLNAILPELTVAPLAMAAHREFSLRIPLPFLRRIDPADPRDPLLRQVLPTAAELDQQPGFTTDPLGESGQQPIPGLLRKYSGRALILVTDACAIHCRYCFRRHRAAPPLPRQEAAWQPLLTELARDDSIHEVILSGGDPLMWSDTDLAKLTNHLAAIPHVRRLRLHTRMPTVTPERIPSQGLSWMTATRLTPICVVQINHPTELDTAARNALTRIIQARVPVLQQAVLLQGVNDRVQVLRSLFEGLIDLGILPYYLHLLDPVAGASHFQVDEETARALLAELQGQLPGYAIPRLAREIPGAASKRIIPVFS